MRPVILFGEPVEPLVPLAELPSPEICVQEEGFCNLRTKPFQIYITKHTVNQVWQHVKKTSQIETGGILVGYPFRCTSNEKIMFVVVCGAIEQDTARRTATQFTVFPEDIQSAREKMAVNFPGMLVVGWYHSHPGHGVFLSTQDMVIVRSIYNAAWHLALVIDPIQNKSAFFYGMKGIRLDSWVILKETPSSIRQLPYDTEIDLSEEKLIQSNNVSNLDTGIESSDEERRRQKQKAIGYAEAGQNRSAEAVLRSLNQSEQEDHDFSTTQSTDNDLNEARKKHITGQVRRPNYPEKNGQTPEQNKIDKKV